MSTGVYTQMLYTRPRGTQLSNDDACLQFRQFFSKDLHDLPDRSKAWAEGQNVGRTSTRCWLFGALEIVEHAAEGGTAKGATFCF